MYGSYCVYTCVYVCILLSMSLSCSCMLGWIYFGLFTFSKCWSAANCSFCNFCVRVFVNFYQYWSLCRQLLLYVYYIKLRKAYVKLVFTHKATAKIVCLALKLFELHLFVHRYGRWRISRLPWLGNRKCSCSNVTLDSNIMVLALPWLRIIQARTGFSSHTISTCCIALLSKLNWLML